VFREPFGERPGRREWHEHGQEFGSSTSTGLYTASKMRASHSPFRRNVSGIYSLSATNVAG
jgi:hypothetical protein